jgi:hypothetical protein
LFFVDTRNLLDKNWVSNPGLTANANGGGGIQFGPRLSFFDDFRLSMADISCLPNLTKNLSG